MQVLLGAGVLGPAAGEQDWAVRGGGDGRALLRLHIILYSLSLYIYISLSLYIYIYM